MISEEELPVDLSASVVTSFRSNPPGSSRSVPSLSGSGPWDLRSDGPDDVDFDLGPESPNSSWAADRFPGAEFNSVLDANLGTIGFFAREAGGGLALLGVASDEPGELVLSYDPAVSFLPAGLAIGQDWTVDAVAEGVVDGQDYPNDLGDDGVVSLHHRYSFAVEEGGVLSLGPFDLPTLRLELALRVEAWNSLAGLFATDTVRVQSFVAECLGVVARVRSHPDEQDPRFVEAEEVLRVVISTGVTP